MTLSPRRLCSGFSGGTSVKVSGLVYLWNLFEEIVYFIIMFIYFL